MRTKSHYDLHLSRHYQWMVGDSGKKINEFVDFVASKEIQSGEIKKALDLGAGHGIQSIALANLGFEVTAVDFCDSLLNEIRTSSAGKNIRVIQSDIVDYVHENTESYDLILCWGDTLTHLASVPMVLHFLDQCMRIVTDQGQIFLSFRDYSSELMGDERFIPVKNDESKILTCFLEYEVDRIKVTDLIHERVDNVWKQSISHYYKCRIDPAKVILFFKSKSFATTFTQQSGMVTIVAKRINLRD